MLRQAGLPAPETAEGVTIAGVTADSRRVEPGFLFVAIPGTSRDGREFIAEAIRRGAAGIVAPPGTAWPEGEAIRIEDPEPRRALARLAAAHAGVQPASVVAVTGTNGKTSTVEFLRQILTRAGRRAASLGTLGLIGGGHDGAGGLTTPDAVTLAETLAALARDGISDLAMEASSHGLAQFRLDGVRLAAGGFSNFTRDHLDYHGTVAAYRAAKLRLANELLPAGAPLVVNADMDAETLAALRESPRRRRLDLATVGENGEALRLIAARPVAQGQVLTLEAAGTRHEVALPLPGRYQADNVLLAAQLAIATGARGVFETLPHLTGVRGRMERVAVLPNGAAAYVDYAHTPDALERLLASLRPHAKRLICVFGAGGDRDPGKRGPMGAAVARLADLAIVTDDNPRGERPEAIRAAILAACPEAREIGDRRAAIAAALDAARPGDVVVVAGKGHETGQIVGGTILPHDDAAVIRELAS